MHALERVLGMAIHHVIAGRSLIIIIPVPVIVPVAVILDAVVYRAIVGILVSGAQGQEVANSMTQTDTKLPGCIDLEVIIEVVPALRLVGVVRHIESMPGVHFQVIEDGAINVDTNAEGTFLHGTEDGTQFQVKSRAVYLHVFQSLRDAATFQVFCIIAVTAVIHVVHANGQSQIDTFVDVSANVEVVFTDITPLVLAKHVSRSVHEIILVQVFIIGHHVRIVRVHGVPGQVLHIA